MHWDYKSSKCYSGDRASLYNELLQDSYLTRNVSHLSEIITLGNLKLNIDWHSVAICISLVLNESLEFGRNARTVDIRASLQRPAATATASLRPRMYKTFARSLLPPSVSPLVVL